MATTSTPMTRARPGAARVALTAACVSLTALVLLHILRPDLDPTWRVISEYAIGEYGWLMQIAFFALAASDLALLVALSGQARSVAGRIGLLLLLVSAVGVTVAGIYTTDPVTTDRDAMTSEGRLHELGAMLDVLPVAALLITWSLVRHNPAWAPARRPLLWTAWLPLFGVVLFIGATAVMTPGDGKLGPGVDIGWPNRIMMLTYYCWLIVVAWQAIRLSSTRHGPAPSTTHRGGTPADGSASRQR
jgi:hypothetical protein